jgi:hypothetical protein
MLNRSQGAVNQAHIDLVAYGTAGDMLPHL